MVEPQEENKQGAEGTSMEARFLFPNEKKSIISDLRVLVDDQMIVA